ncbi:hypothetical protein BJ742DRAFT_779340 [Cladochytrium replicatum]|nr:hypothetical protein BJ742DRAFT_779340 [Cladochytrium replicatum]
MTIWTKKLMSLLLVLLANVTRVRAQLGSETRSVLSSCGTLDFPWTVRLQELKAIERYLQSKLLLATRFSDQAISRLIDVHVVSFAGEISLLIGIVPLCSNSSILALVPNATIRTSIGVLNAAFQNIFSFTIRSIITEPRIPVPNLDTLAKTTANAAASGWMGQYCSYRSGRQAGTDLFIFIGDMAHENNQSINGFATVPREGALPDFDGVYIKYDRLHPRIGTLVHEVGHWLGLSHTFGDGNDDSTCASPEIDDGVYDTPPHPHPSQDHPTMQGWQKEGSCPSENNATIPDSCPDGVGVDPIFNYMNYSHCRRKFTPEQLRRMAAVYDLRRKGVRISSCPAGPDITDGRELDFDSKTPSGLSVGAVVAISVAAGLVVVAAVCGTIAFAFRKRKPEPLLAGASEDGVGTSTIGGTSLEDGNERQYVATADF